MTAATDTPECVKEVRSGKTRRLERGGFFLAIGTLVKVDLNNQNIDQKGAPLIAIQ
jgi:hypothetical protein